jgi:hypothetical protein
MKPKIKTASPAAKVADPVSEAYALSKSGVSRQFRDALTRASGAIQGARTNALHWTGTSGSK